MDQVTITDGKHRAHLCGAKTGASHTGNRYVNFQWQLADGTGRRIYSSSYLNRKDGSRNESGIALLRKWATGWDGNDPAWFVDNLDALRGIEVELIIKNKPWYKDQSKISPQVLFVNPVAATSAATSEERKTQPFAERLPTVIAPNMLDVWQAFREATEGMDAHDRDLLWLSIVETTVPGKDQDLFTDEDWQSVINAMKGV